jgi:hypothetical protein
MSRTQQRTVSPPESDGPVNRRNRRQLLALGGTATAAATVAALGLARPESARAATGGNFILGEENFADKTTVLEKTATPAGVWTHALEVRHYAGPQAVAIVGIANDGIGVAGASPSGTGVTGKTQIGTGVTGIADTTGIGVHGLSQGGTGMEGEAPGDEHPGVRAISRSGPPYPPDGGLALEVIGKARFSTAGAGAVPRGRRIATVSDPAVTAASHITVTLTGNPGTARFDWLERQPGSGFVVHLAGLALWEIPFTYLVIEPRA